MSTDLAKAPDHPATLVYERAEKITRSISGTPAERSAVFNAASYLQQYEDEHGVTFAALDNDTLIEVRRAYDNLDDPGLQTIDGLYEFIGAVRDLLGLGEVR